MKERERERERSPSIQIYLPNVEKNISFNRRIEFLIYNGFLKVV